VRNMDVDRNGDPVMATRTIREYEDLLPESIFCRIHSSHIINLTRIEKYQKGRGGMVLMEDGTTIEVAVRRRLRIGLPLRFRMFEGLAAPQVRRAAALDLEALKQRLESVATG